LKTLIFRRLAASLLLLVSAVPAADEIRVETDADGVIVRSPAAAANFLFRAPAGFRPIDREEGFAIALAAEEGGARATIRLRLGELTATEARAGLDAFVKAREQEYSAGLEGALGTNGGRGRRLAAIEGKEALRLVLVVFDGARRYELFLEGAPGDSELAGRLAPVAEGFTILDPKGAPEAPGAATGDAKASALEHAYYRLKVLKPEGFLQQDVDPSSDPGIFLHLRREDDEKNRCDIRVRVFLAKATKEQPDAKAQKRIDDFRKQHESPRGPARPPRGRWPGATAAYRFKQVGKITGGAVVEEEWLVIDHANGRVYEIEVATYAGAARAFKKEIEAFWRGIRIQEK
jgi:hypothetical protein